MITNTLEQWMNRKKNHSKDKKLTSNLRNREREIKLNQLPSFVKLINSRPQIIKLVEDISLNTWFYLLY